MTDRRIQITPTDDLEPGRLADLTALCVAAFEEPQESIWVGVGHGLHVVADVGGRAVAHAMIVDRTLHVGAEADVSIDAGYVELVATWPDLQGRGHATAVMRAVGEIIGEEYAVGALAAGAMASTSASAGRRGSGRPRCGCRTASGCEARPRMGT